MKILITAILVVHTCCLLYAEEARDPFAESDQQDLAPPAAAEDAEPKIITNFTCVGSGTLEGEELDTRVESIVLAISAFYEQERRVPTGLLDLRTFCDKHELELHDLSKLSPVEFLAGTFKYSAGYSSGTLHLSHRSGCYFMTASLQPFDDQNPMLPTNNKQNKAEMATPRKPSD